MFNVPSGLPLCAQDVFPDSDDPFISVKGGQAKFLSPPSYSHSHSTLSPDNLRPETALRQQISRRTYASRLFINYALHTFVTTH